MKRLYQEVTGDTATHQRTIAAHAAKLDARRRQMISARLEGQSLRQIGAAHGVSVGSVQSAINGAMEIMRKRIAGEPRYSVSRQRKDRNAAATDGATPHAPTTTQARQDRQQQRRRTGLLTV